MKNGLMIDPNLSAPDEFYEMLIEAHRDLAPEQSASLNAALILLLANHIGDARALAEAIVRARSVVESFSKP